MGAFARRVLASVLVGLLSTSCATVRANRQPEPDVQEVFFLPSAPRAVASPVVGEVELRKALEEILPHVNVAAARAELRRLVADPRFHHRRPEQLRVVLASWGSGPAALAEITRGYRDWRNRSEQSECLSRTLTDSDVYEIAFDFALGGGWDGVIKEVKSTIDPSTIQFVILTGMVIFMASIAFPELTSKIPAAAATMILTAYLGAQTVWELIFGWVQMVGQLDAATTFDEVRAAGQRYGERVGAQTTRILITLAIAAIAEGGVIARLMKLPRASQASAAMAAETGGGLQLEMAGQAKGVRVTASGVAIAVEGPVKGAVGFAMAAHGPVPGSAPSEPRPFTADNFRKNLGRLTGGTPEGADAHHVFPQKFEPDFRRAGINIHDPRYGAWWETTAHQQAGYEYNEQWQEFFRDNRTPTTEQILQFGRTISSNYGLHVGF